MSYLNFLEVRLSVALCDEEARHVVLADVELAMSLAEVKLVEEQLRARRRAEDRTPPVSWMRVRLRECVCGRGPARETVWVLSSVPELPTFPHLQAKMATPPAGSTQLDTGLNIR